MITSEDVCAVIVTRGDVDLMPVLDSIPFQTIVWDNSERDDIGIYGRYQAIQETDKQVIYTQDDDVIVSCYAELLAAYKPGVLTVNYYPPVDIPWVARGAVFARDLPAQAFLRYFKAGFSFDRFFTHFACDGIFGLLTQTQVIDMGAVNLPHGLEAGRVSTTAGWYEERRPLIQQRCMEVVAS